MVDASEGVLGIEWIEGKSVRFLLGGGAEGEEEVEETDDVVEPQEEEDEDSERHSPVPRIDKGKSPYLHPGASSSMAKFMSRSQLRFKSHSPEPTSPPSSPLSPSTTSFFRNPSAWASTVTLSLTSALGNNGHAGDQSLPTTLHGSKSLKRKESFGVKRLFASLKGKEREREHCRTQSLPHVIPGSTFDHASIVSSSESESTTESIDGWEVVSVNRDVEDDSVHSKHSAKSTATSTAPTSPTRSIAESVANAPHSPSAEHGRPATLNAAFINRPVRHRAPGESPTTPLSPTSPALLPAFCLPPLRHIYSRLPSTPPCPAAIHLADSALPRLSHHRIDTRSRHLDCCAASFSRPPCLHPLRTS